MEESGWTHRRDRSPPTARSGRIGWASAGLRERDGDAQRQGKEYRMSDQSQEVHDEGRPAPRRRGKNDLKGAAQSGGRTLKGTPRQRRTYRPRRDRGRFKLTPRDEWGMRHVASMRALRFDQLLDMFALWHYQQDLATYEKQLDLYQRQPVGDAPVPPVLQPQAKGKVQSIIHRWIEHGYAITDQPHDQDPVWFTLTAKAMRELKLSYEAGFPPKEDLKEEGHIFACNEVRFKLMRTKTYGKYVWWSERAIKANWQEGTAGLDYDQLPDAELYLNGVAQICVEVELTRKSDDRYDQILADLTRLYPQVLYCVRGEGLYRVLMSARERLGDERKSQVSVLLLS
jgi:hypothetical protein